MCQIIMSALPGLDQSAIVRANKGVLGMGTTGLLQFCSSAGGGALAQGTIACAANAPLSLGLRYQTGSNALSFFINGRREDFTSTALANASEVVEVLHGVADTRAAVGRIRDIRIWNRYLSDEAFKRYYTNPADFYTRASIVDFRGITFKGGSFIPFLHPYLTS